MWQNSVWPCVKGHAALSACAKSRQPGTSRKSFTMIFLGDHDIPLTGSNFGNLTAFRAIFSHIFTAHAQERPLMSFRLKFWHHHSIPWSRFPYRARYFGDTRPFSDDFCIGYAERPPYFYFRSSWPTDLESVSRDAHLVVTCARTAIYELLVKVLTSSFDSLIPISLQGTLFRRYKDVFCGFLHWISWMSAIFLLQL